MYICVHICISVHVYVYIYTYMYYAQRGRHPAVGWSIFIAPISLESKFFLIPFSNFSVACCWIVENQPPFINPE